MSYPTPAALRFDAEKARQTASEYRRDADTQREPYRSQWLDRANECDDRADWYEWKAQCEELRLSHLNPHKEAA